MSYKGVPTIRKRLLGGQLRRLREERDITVESVAIKLGVGVSAVRRQESGHTAVSVADAKAYAEIYGVEDEKLLERLVQLAKHGRVRGWWSGYSSKVGPTIVDVADVEDLATDIRTFQILAIPGIFQTREYSSAIIEVGKTLRRGGQPLPLDELLDLRQRRKEILERDNPPQVWAIIGEAAIRTVVGGPAVMRDQIQHLLNLSQRHNISIQILPFSAGEHVGMSGSFMLLSFDDTADGSITYVEGTNINSFSDDPAEVRLTADRFTHLQAQALSIVDTRTYLLEALSAK